MKTTAATWLVSEEGRGVASAVAADQGDDWRRLRRLRKTLDAERAAAVMSLLRGRRSMAGRHGRADELFVTVDAARQASSEATARWRARRFAGRGIVADVTASVGIDALALAEHAAVVAMDRARDRLVLARANLAGAPHGALCIAAEAPAAVPRVAAVFCDPDRRLPDGRRLVDPEDASPPLGDLLAAMASLGVAGVAVKLSPMVDLAPLRARGELELISVSRELKEVVLWTRDLAQSTGGGVRVTRADRGFTWTAEPRPAPPPAPPGAWLWDPDPALVRSGLLGALAADLGAAPLEPTIAYLTAPSPANHPLLTSRRILAVLPSKPRMISRFLDTHGIGRVTAARRGHPTAPEEVLSRLRLAGGDGAAHLVLTRTTDSYVVLATTTQPEAG